MLVLLVVDIIVVHALLLFLFMRMLQLISTHESTTYNKILGERIYDLTDN